MVKEIAAPADIIGEWQHIVVSYGDISPSQKSYVRLWLNGQKMLTKKACDSPSAVSCGKIMYPVPAFENSNCMFDAPLTIGTTINGFDRTESPHIGIIKRVRMFQRALQDSESLSLYHSSAAALRGTLVPQTAYWVKGVQRLNEQGNAWIGAVSPTGDYTYVDNNNSTILVRGRFIKERRYTCEFRYGDVVHESPPGVVQCSRGFVLEYPT
jgi:hypothetical protein